MDSRFRAISAKHIPAQSAYFNGPFPANPPAMVPKISRNINKLTDSQKTGGPQPRRRRQPMPPLFLRNDLSGVATAGYLPSSQAFLTATTHSESSTSEHAINRNQPFATRFALLASGGDVGGYLWGALESTGPLAGVFLGSGFLIFSECATLNSSKSEYWCSLRSFLPFQLTVTRTFLGSQNA